MAYSRRQLSSLLKRIYVKSPRLLSGRKYGVDTDGDVNHMRTTVSIVNEEHDYGIFIDTYSQLGFRLSNGIRVIGPCAIFPRSVLHWNIRNVDDINEKSLSLFTMLEPKIDILVVGVGERENIAQVKLDVIKFLRTNKVNTEFLPTDQALSTFNFLNAEKRYVAGAFIPPTYVDTSEDEDIYAGIGVNVNSHVMQSMEIDAAPDDITTVLQRGAEGREKLRDLIREKTNRPRSSD